MPAGVYIPTIFEAVFARNFSSDKEVRKEGYQKLSATAVPVVMDTCAKKLGDALLLSIIVSYAQGMALIAKASDENGWDIDLADLIGVWRAGCIIRSELLTEVKDSLKENEKNLIRQTPSLISAIWTRPAGRLSPKRRMRRLPFPHLLLRFITMITTAVSRCR